MNNERGNALFLVILTLVFIAVVGVGLLTVTANSNKITVHERQNQSLYYVAEAGINISKSNIVQSINDIADSTSSYINKLPAKERTQAEFIKKAKEQLHSMFCSSDLDQKCSKFIEVHNKFEVQNGKHPLANVSSTFECEDKSQTTICTIELVSKGFFTENVADNRTLTQKIEIDLNRLMNVKTVSNNGETTDPGDNSLTLLDMIRGFAALTSETIKIDKGGKIEGNIGSLAGDGAITDNADDKRTKVQNVSAFKGIDLNVLLPPFPNYPVNPINFSNIAYVNNNFNLIPDYNLGNLGNAESATVQSNAGIKIGVLTSDLLDLSNKRYVNMKSLSTSKRLEIRIGNKDVYLVVDDLEIKTSDEVVITGTGKLHLIVKNKMILKEKINEKGSSNLLTIYYESNNDLLIDDGTAYIGGNLYVRNARNVTMKNSSGIKGDLNILQGNLFVEAGTDIGGSVYLEKGNATFNTGSKISGDILIKEGNLTFNNLANVQSIYINKGNVNINSGITVNKDIFIKEGNLTVNNSAKMQSIYMDKGKIHINAGATVNKDIIQRKGELEVTGALGVQNIYLDTVDVVFDNSVKPKINKIFYLNKGDVNLMNDVGFLGDYIQQEGSLNIAKQTNFEGNTYLGKIDLSAANSVDFLGDLYLKEGDLNLGSSSDVFGDLYVLKGRINSTNIVDFHGNIYYADVHDVTFAKWVDAKKNQLIVAPNAKFLIEKGSVDVKGTVVAKHVHVKDGYIKYEQPTNIDDYYSNTPIPLDDDVIFTPLNDYMKESPLIEL